MKIINVIKCEFIKNFNLKNILVVLGTLLLSVIILTNINIHNNHLDTKINFDDLIKESENNLEQTKNLSYPPLKQEYYEYYYQKEKEALEHLKNDIYHATKINVQNDWQYRNYKYTILDNEKYIYIINLLLNERNNDDIKKILENPSSDDFDSIISLLKDYTNEELQQLQIDYQKEIDTVKTFVDNNNNYELFKNNSSLLENTNPKFQKYLNLVLQRKINYDNNYNYENLSMYNGNYYNWFDSKELLPSDKYYIKLDENEFNNGSMHCTNITNCNIDQSAYYTFKAYNNAYKLFTKDFYAKKNILEYALENNLPTNILNNGTEPHSFNAKNNVYTISSLSFIIMILIIFTSVNIISNEYNKGTNKILFTSSIKKWKILLGKFLYLIIHSYILWLVLFIILYFYSGIRFGFKDLLYPELIFNGKKVIEINFIIYNIIEIMVINIPIIGFISLMLLISTLFINNVFTTMLSTFLALITSCIWFLITEFNLYFLSNTMFPYFNLYEIIIINKEIFPDNYFLDAIRFVSSNLSKGIIICLITIIINYIITNYIFSKRDI